MDEAEVMVMLVEGWQQHLRQKHMLVDVRSIAVP